MWALTLDAMARKNSKKQRQAARAKRQAATERARYREWLEQIHQTVCPCCSDRNTAWILYGLPRLDEAMHQDLADGLLALGGCDLFSDRPTYHCNGCGHEWAAPGGDR